MNPIADPSSLSTLSNQVRINQVRILKVRIFGDVVRIRISNQVRMSDTLFVTYAINGLNPNPPAALKSFQYAFNKLAQVLRLRILLQHIFRYFIFALIPPRSF